MAACGFVWPRRHLPIPSHHTRCAYGHSCSESSRGWGCVVTGVGVCVGPWAFVVRDLWVGGGGGWLSFQSLLGLLSLTPCTPYGGPHHTLTSRAVKGGRLGGLWGGEWWDSLPSPPPSHLFLCLKLNEGPAHAGVQRAHQCLSTLSLPPHEQLPRHLTDPLSHTLHQPRLNFFPCLSPKNKSMLFCFISDLGGGARRKTHNPPSCPPHHHLSLARIPHCGVHINATSLL